MTVTLKLTYAYGPRMIQMCLIGQELKDLLVPLEPAPLETKPWMMDQVNTYLYKLVDLFTSVMYSMI
jgi:hypothetical protein